MANETTITIRGNLGADPQFFEGANGCAARFNVAVSVAKFRPQANGVESLVPQWFAVKAFGELGRNIIASVRRGSPVIVRGELVTEYWRDSGGAEHSRQVIRADSVGIDLRNGTAQYTKTVRNSPEADALDGVRPDPGTAPGQAGDGQGQWATGQAQPAGTLGQPGTAPGQAADSSRAGLASPELTAAFDAGSGSGSPFGEGAGYGASSPSAASPYDVTGYAEAGEQSPGEADEADLMEDEPEREQSLVGAG